MRVRQILKILSFQYLNVINTVLPRIITGAIIQGNTVKYKLSNGIARWLMGIHIISL